MSARPVQFSSGGLALRGELHTPAVLPAPAFVCIHGLTLNHHMFEPLAARAEAAGIACLRFHLRGHGDSEGRLEEQGFEEQVADLRAALAFMRARPEVEASRLGLLGFSLGGALASVAAAREAPGAIKALATWGSLLDTGHWMKLRLAEYGAPSQGLVKIWDEIPVSSRLFSEAIANDPFGDALAFKGPFFAAHGGKDQNHPPAKSRELVAKRQELGRPAEGFFPEKSGHKFRVAEDWEALCAKTLAFFQASL